MEHCKISKLLRDSNVSKYVTKKWIQVNDLSGGQYSVNKNLIFKISMLRSDLCDHSDVYVVVQWTICPLIAVPNENDNAQKNVALKKNALCRSCISKINITLIDNLEDLDIVMPMYNLLECSQIYSMRSGSLWNCYRDKTDDVDDNASEGKSFKYKTKIVGKTPQRPAQPNWAPQPPLTTDGSQLPRPPRTPRLPVPALNVEVTIPLKYLSNFWRFLDLKLINCAIELDLSWTKDCPW